VLYTGNYSTWWNLLVGSGAGNVTHGVMASRWRLTGATISASLLCAGAYIGGSPWGPLSRRHNVAQSGPASQLFVSRVCETAAASSYTLHNPMSISAIEGHMLVVCGDLYSN
jgi:hypothetical protein